MTPTLHLEGMGLVGSLVAWSLYREKKPFTWNDNDNLISAWRASTGCVFPTGLPDDVKGYTQWFKILEDPIFNKHIGQFVEYARWSYLSNTPPHQGAKAGVLSKGKVGPIHISNAETFQFNVQDLVEYTRKRFASRGAAPQKGQRIIVTHGTATAHRYVWGWSVPAELKLSKALTLQEETIQSRLCLYLRKGYSLNYLYPKPGTDIYYGGTATLSQTKPKELEVESKVYNWKAKVYELSDGHVFVRRTGPAVQGWRPVAPDTTPLVKVEKDRIVLRAQSGNGVRHYPLLMEALWEVLDA